MSRLIDVLELILCIDVGCICGLTPTAEFKREGKWRFWINVAQHTHVNVILVQTCLSKYLGEIKI